MFNFMFSWWRSQGNRDAPPIDIPPVVDDVVLAEDGVPIVTEDNVVLKEES